MTVAVVVNEYPKLTLTFVRTEIRALERAGLPVERIAIRRAATALIDSVDRDEAVRTRVVLDVGMSGLAAALARTATARPDRFARALGAALRIGRRSERGIARHLAYLAEACVLLDWSAERAIAHLHASFGANPAAVAMLCRFLGGPTYSFAAHGPEEFERAVRLAIAEKVRHAAFVTVVSEAGGKELREHCRAEDHARIHLVRCGIDERFREGEPTPVPTARRIAYVGRLCAEKAPLAAVEAVARLRAAGEPCELTVIGDGPLRTALEARIRALRLDGSVTLLGWASTDDVRRHVLAARAVVLPSVAEGLPVALMEALALHRPVICTPVGGVRELVEDGISGWLVPPGSIEGLAAAMGNALNSPPERLEEMGRRGAARVARQHDPDAAARKLASLFAAVTAATDQAAAG